MKCTLLIAEDHALTANYLHQKIDWGSIGIDVIGVASNGKEAVTIMQNQVPDILLTDIRMPNMDGLQLIRYIQERKQKTKPIILTAYDEFTYAQEAIRYGAVGYVLKPIEDKVLRETLKHIRDKIEDEHNVLFDEMKERFPVLRNDFFQKLLHGSCNCEKELHDALRFLQLDFPTISFCVAAVEIDHPSCTMLRDRSHQEEITSRLVDTAEDVFRNEHTIYSAYMREAIVFIICCHKKDSPAELHSIRKLMTRCQVKFTGNTGCTCSIGLSSCHDGLFQLATCYSEAITALRSKFLSGPAKIYVFSKKNELSSFRYPFEHEKHIITYISIGNEGAR